MVGRREVGALVLVNLASLLLVPLPGFPLEQSVLPIGTRLLVVPTLLLLLNLLWARWAGARMSRRAAAEDTPPPAPSLSPGALGWVIWPAEDHRPLAAALLHAVERGTVSLALGADQVFVLGHEPLSSKGATPPEESAALAELFSAGPVIQLTEAHAPRLARARLALHRTLQNTLRGRFTPDRHAVLGLALVIASAVLAAIGATGRPAVTVLAALLLLIAAVVGGMLLVMAIRLPVSRPPADRSPKPPAGDPERGFLRPLWLALILIELEIIVIGSASVASGLSPVLLIASVAGCLLSRVVLGPRAAARALRIWAAAYRAFVAESRSLASVEPRLYRGGEVPLPPLSVALAVATGVWPTSSAAAATAAERAPLSGPHAWRALPTGERLADALARLLPRL